MGGYKNEAGRGREWTFPRLGFRGLKYWCRLGKAGASPRGGRNGDRYPQAPNKRHPGLPGSVLNEFPSQAKSPLGGFGPLSRMAGKAMGRSGLRMMPTVSFPPPKLRTGSFSPYRVNAESVD